MQFTVQWCRGTFLRKILMVSIFQELVLLESRVAINFNTDSFVSTFSKKL